VVACGIVSATLACASSGPAEPVKAAYEPPKHDDDRPSAQQVLKDAKVRGVVVGETTREDLLTRFGYPTHRVPGANGEEIWTYLAALQPRYAKTGASTTAVRVAAQRKLFITFDAGSATVSRIQVFETGMADASAVKDTGAEFPELEPVVLFPVNDQAESTPSP